MLNCYIICFNNGWLVRNTVDALKRFSQEVKCIVVDNCSTGARTKNTLAELQAEGVEVRHMTENFGHKVVQNKIRPSEPMYIITDPDLDLTKLPSDTIKVLMNYSDRLRAYKVGLALDISCTDDLLEGEYYDNVSIAQWESRFWQDRKALLEHEVYDADIDTTFALYNQRYTQAEHNGRGKYRLAGPYTVRHLMWHKSWVEQLDEEDYKEYFLTAKSISTTSKLVQPYFDELQRKRLQDQDQH